MKNRIAVAFAVLGLLAGWSTELRAQAFSLVPSAGVYFQASSFREIEGEVDDIRVEQEATLGFALGVEYGVFRATAAYASGATLNRHGVDNGQELGEGDVLAVTGGVVLRPLGETAIQPYLLGGAGVKRTEFSFDDVTLANLFPGAETDFAVQLGVGLAFMVGRLGLVVEANDFVSLNGDSGPHDVFVTVGLRLGPF